MSPTRAATACVLQIIQALSNRLRISVTVEYAAFSSKSPRATLRHQKWKKTIASFEGHIRSITIAVVRAERDFLLAAVDAPHTTRDEYFGGGDRLEAGDP